MKTFEIIAKTLFGLEELLAGELRDLGATDITVLTRAVKYRGDQALMYRSNLYLRTALSILKPIAVFTANDEKDLYNKVKAISWGDYLNTNQTFAIDSTSKSEVFRHSKFIALKTKDAIVDQFRERSGIRPSIDVENPDLRINLHITDRTCTISLDSSGATLDKRGYRLARTLAPINEVLAAGIILFTGWDRKSEFNDAMCGSGTFPIEAAMMAAGIAPGRLRHFAFQGWNDFSPSLWKEILKEADAKVKPVPGTIFATDIDDQAIEISKQNARRANMERFITFQKKDFFQISQVSGKGLLVMNPPYGERLQQEEINTYYKDIGARLKHHWQGYEAWMISANMDALKFVGLKPSKKLQLFNGALECKLHKYEMYQGSRRPDDERKITPNQES